MTINERIRKYREYKKMTRDAFGSLMGVSGDVINNIERGRVELTEERILLILKTFSDINENWLRNDIGEMINATRSSEISEFISETTYLLPDSAQQQLLNRFISAIQKLDEKDLIFLLEILDKIRGSD